MDGTMTDTYRLNPNMTKTEATIDWITKRIEWQVYKPYQKVPSIRQLAKLLGISSFTVSQAYEQLVATNVLTAKQGSGYYVNNPAVKESRVDNEVKVIDKNPEIDTKWLVRQMFSDTPLDRAPGSGVLPREWIRNDKMEWAIRQVANQSDDFIYDYGDIQGFLPLRQQLVQYLGALGMQTTADHIITTAGISQAVLMVANLLLNEGDAVIVDEPGWFWLSSSLQRHGFQVVSVKRDHQGPDIEQMAQLFERYRPKMYLTNSVLHNPTSYNLHPARVHQVLNLIHKYDAYIFEDDLYAALLPEDYALRYSSLDQFERVFYATGFSKYMASGWRVGLLVCPDKFTDDIIGVKTLSNMTTPEFGERVIHKLWTHGESRRQLKKLQENLYNAHQNLREKLTAIQLEYPEHTQQGMFVWVDVGCDTAKLALKAHNEGWLVAPGALFNPNGDYSTHLRLNVATTSDEFLRWLGNYIADVVD